MIRPTRREAALVFAALFTAGCAGGRRVAPRDSFEPSRFQRWSEETPPYRLFPGDTVEVTVHTAEELSGPRQIGPDGRVNLPLAGAIMVTGMTAPQSARLMAERYAGVLRDPIVEVRLQNFGAQRILVGGEVGDPGLHEMPSARIGVLEAVMLAGGPTPRARRGRVAVLRRAENGGVMMREVDLSAALRGGDADSTPLMRHDIVFVPRSGIAEVNDFVEQYVRNILPIDAAFSYALADSLFND